LTKTVKVATSKKFDDIQTDIDQSPIL